jgi:hypothetical protein
MSDHSQLAPSSADRRMQCPGSRRLQKIYPESEDNPAAIEGDLAHAYLAEFMRGKELPSTITEEMYDAIMMFKDSIDPTDIVIGYIEQKLTMRTIHPEAYGTPDFWAWFPEKHILDIRDFKFGHGFVDEFENWQLLMYAIGAIEREESTFRRFTIDGDFEVRMTIVQPRNYSSRGPVRTWSITSKELRERYLPRLIDNCVESMRDDAPTEVGTHCANCSAAHACETLQASAYNVVKVIGRGQTFDLPSNTIGKEMKLLDDCMEVLKARTNALETEMIARIKEGEILTGWQLEQGYGRQKWTVSANEVIEMAKMMEVDVAVPGVLTPVQAIKKGFAKELVESISERPKGEVKLVAFAGISQFKG